MKKIYKNGSGITLIIVIITITIMLLLVGTIIISAGNYGEIKDLKRLAADLEVLQERVNLYYEKNNDLPADVRIEANVATVLGDDRNSNDDNNYYIINLQYFDSMNLNFGFNKTENDYYIVNEGSRNVYYYKGIEAGGEMFFGIKDIQPNFANSQFVMEGFELKTRTNATSTNGVLDIQLEVYSDFVNANIVSYKFKIDNGEWSAPQSGNSFIYHHLERFKTYKVSMIAMDSSQNEIYASNNELEVTINTVPINLTYDGKTVGTYNNPLIPAGFTPINENNAYWQSSDGYKSGLVIEDPVNGNQFVWVPVDGIKVPFARYDFAKGVSFTSCSETMLTQLSTSVSTNGGFYIARYEAGIAAGMSKPAADTTTTYGNGTYKPVSKAGVDVWNYIKWGTSNSDSSPGNGAVTVAKNMYASSDANYGATSTLIYAAQWDAVLKFIGAYDVGEAGYSTYATNSTGMGNYSGTSGGDTTTATPATCGLLDAFRQKNIYDMAGNVWEWTMEALDSYRVLRGGYFGYSSSVTPSSYRVSEGFTSLSNSVGFRVALYIEN